MRVEKEILKAVPVRRRSAARLAAVQITYQSLMTGQSALDIVGQFLTNYADDVAKSFKVKNLDEVHLSSLYTGVENNVETIDFAIAAELTEGWSLDRLTRIELSVLRCGTYEIQSMLDIPVKAAVSEYASLSDACGCDVAFVNAVLDQLARAARDVEMDKRGQRSTLD